MNGDGDQPHLVTAQFATVYLHTFLPSHPTITEQQIRKWASRGHIGRHGKYWTQRTGQDRTLYDLREIMAYVRRRGL